LFSRAKGDRSQQAYLTMGSRAADGDAPLHPGEQLSDLFRFDEPKLKKLIGDAAKLDVDLFFAG